jgi:hypothetical protein
MVLCGFITPVLPHPSGMFSTFLVVQHCNAHRTWCHALQESCKEAIQTYSCQTHAHLLRWTASHAAPRMADAACAGWLPASGILRLGTRPSRTRREARALSTWYWMSGRRAQKPKHDENDVQAHLWCCPETHHLVPVGGSGITPVRQKGTQKVLTHL